jgi:hypothetical protein
MKYNRRTVIELNLAPNVGPFKAAAVKLIIDDEKPQGETVIEINFGAQRGATSIDIDGYRI